MNLDEKLIGKHEVLPNVQFHLTAKRKINWKTYFNLL